MSRGYRVRVASEPVPDILLGVDELMARADATLLKRGSRTTVAMLRVADATLVLKRFQDETCKRRVEVLALGSSAWRAWQGAARIRAAGFPAPDMVAVLERHSGGLATRSCTIAHQVPGSPLDERWRSATAGERRALARGFATYLQALHAAGLYPQDLRAANLLVTDEPRPRFVLVDLDRVRRYRRLGWRRRRKNLVQVHRSVGRGVAASISLRFLAWYLGSAERWRLRASAAEIIRLGTVKDAEYRRRRSRGT